MARALGVIGLAMLPLVALRARAVYRFVRELGPPARRRWFYRTVLEASVPVMLVCVAVLSFDPPSPVADVFLGLSVLSVFSAIFALAQWTA